MSGRQSRSNRSGSSWKRGPPTNALGRDGVYIQPLSSQRIPPFSLFPHSQAPSHSHIQSTLTLSLQDFATMHFTSIFFAMVLGAGEFAHLLSLPIPLTRMSIYSHRLAYSWTDSGVSRRPARQHQRVDVARSCLARRFHRGSLRGRLTPMPLSVARFNVVVQLRMHRQPSLLPTKLQNHLGRASARKSRPPSASQGQRLLSP